ncbi:ribosome biogenesis protein NOP53 [Musca vetustissima]|uniref:ribosome biogenesis protein NOP53 n=1 Tax=Musca vetustissima TaxID=27455 RepID=UPI002AB6FEB4|nr:ribosome biogenesis protein NOP53 [Musca vetustissima]
MSVQKKKRISKKNKSAWRKTDIQDVEEYLEEQRQEERIGTFTEKKDEELFKIDVTPADAKKPTALTEKQKRKLNAKKPLRSLQVLENTSKVQDPIVKRNIVKQKKAGRNIEEEVINPTKPRHIQANQDRAKTYAKVEEKVKKLATKIPDTNKDIWQEEDFREKVPGLKDEKGWISEELAKYNAQKLGLPVYKIHDSIRHRTTKAKKFEPPHPGTSYNPSLQDHQKLISDIVEKEEKLIKEEKHLKRVTTQMFRKVTAEERQQQHIQEMSAGLDDDEDEAEEGDNDEGDENNAGKKSKKAKKEDQEGEEDNSDDSAPYDSINPPVENKKKSKAQRNRELRQKELQKKLEAKKALKKQIADLNRIKSLKTEVLIEEEELKEAMKRRKKAEFKKKFETKRLGRLKFNEPDQDVNMPEELAGNVRNIQTGTSLLVDRFKNFQKRNILPVSVATGKQKKPKVKRFPRSTHKDPGVSYQMLRDKRMAEKKAAAQASK